MNKLFSIAKEVRAWAEQKEIKANPKKSKSTLMGWCAIASCHLFRQLSNAGFKPEIHLFESDRYSHVYIVVDDYVVDVTATQFNEFKRTPVAIIHQKEAEQYEFYNSTYIFKFPADLREYQFKSGWVKDQIAFTR